MLTDAGGLLVALVASRLVLRPPTARRTWGLRRLEVLAALAQSAILLAVGVYVLVEGIARLLHPPEVPSAALVVFGVVGLVGNLVSLAVLSGGRTASFNLRAAFLEVLNDALGSVGVIVAAIVIATTGWYRAFRLLRETSSVLLETTPAGLDLDAVRAQLLQVDHVRDVHDLHASLIATGLPTLSAHVVVDGGCFQDGHAPQILDALQDCVATRFDVPVEHSTFQLEPVTHAAHEAPGHP
jgi:cobalt-zinc-cadmium efflux system protein